MQVLPFTRLPPGIDFKYLQYFKSIPNFCIFPHLKAFVHTVEQQFQELMRAEPFMHWQYTRDGLKVLLFIYLFMQFSYFLHSKVSPRLTKLGLEAMTHF